MARFFVDTQLLNNDFILLTGENAEHAKVLRLKAGETVTVSDGMSQECVCTVSDVGNGQISLAVKQRQNNETEAKVQASVYMAFSKGDKFEHVIQKATELGAYEIVAFPTSRCVSKPDDKSLRKKLERWQKIAISAAEQSGRGRVPAVHVLNSYKEALVRASKADLSILFYENEHARSLSTALHSVQFQSISLLTGPEGGLELKEVEQASDAGLQVCTLGKRILRCETAPLCALSAVMYHIGEF